MAYEQRGEREFGGGNDGGGGRGRGRRKFTQFAIFSLLLQLPLYLFMCYLLSWLPIFSFETYRQESTLMFAWHLSSL